MQLFQHRRHYGLVSFKIILFLREDWNPERLLLDIIRVYLGEYSLYQDNEPLPRQKFFVRQDRKRQDKRSSTSRKYFSKFFLSYSKRNHSCISHKSPEMEVRHFTLFELPQAKGTGSRERICCFYKIIKSKQFWKHIGYKTMDQKESRVQLVNRKKTSSAAKNLIDISPMYVISPINFT